MTENISYILLIVFSLVTISDKTMAAEYDFDKLNSTIVSPSKKAQTIDGVKDTSEKALLKQKDRWAEEEAARVRGAEESYKRSQAERSLGNGNRYYECEFSCRTDGFLLYDGTDKMKQIVKADESWQAENLVKDNAKKICSSITSGTSKYMWVTGLSCTEKR